MNTSEGQVFRIIQSMLSKAENYKILYRRSSLVLLHTVGVIKKFPFRIHSTTVKR